MPVTAYSISEQKELDVEQVLRSLSRRDGLPGVARVDQIPDTWRAFLRSDLECPCCFVSGAEVVKESVSRLSKKAVRQACFRFVTPGHRPQCDYVSNESSDFTPANLVQFGIANSNLTRVVRDLVCTGIQSNAFSQKSIRDMREWFFQEKTNATFRVVLDPRIPKWIDKLWRTEYSPVGVLPAGVELTAEIASVPGFDWAAESARVLRERHKVVLGAIREKHLWMHGVAERIESLARRYHGEHAFDPSVLEDEYNKSLELARFISRNYAPLKAVSNRNADVAACVLALSALLLFVNKWDPSRAAATFAAIAIPAAGNADIDLGNVIGLNPFHDFEAWSKLKQLQESGIVVPEEIDPGMELKKIEDEIRSRLRPL